MFGSDQMVWPGTIERTRVLLSRVEHRQMGAHRVPDVTNSYPRGPIACKNPMNRDVASRNRGMLQESLEHFARGCGTAKAVAVLGLG